VPELGIHYQNSMASLVPIFFGSGTRVKAIESCLMKRACISTDMGVEGMGLKAGTHYLSVHTAQEWIEAIGKLTLDEAEGMGNRAFEYAVKQFDPDVIARKFLDTLIQ
jgi:hypothetical protein